MAQERVQKVRKDTVRPKPQDAPEERQEVREDVRRTWWPEA